MKRPLHVLGRISRIARRPLAALWAATALMAVPMLATAWSASPGHQPVTGTTAAAGPQIEELDVCFTTAPDGWAGTPRASFPTTVFIVEAVAAAGDRAYGGYFRSVEGDHGIAVLDLRTGALTRLVAFPAESSGIASLAVDRNWMAWVQGDSKYIYAAWTVYARNLDTGEQVTLATSRLPDGSYVSGQLLLISVSKGVVTWAQPTSSAGQPPNAEVRVYDLAARRQSILDSGRVSSPVFAGRYMVWGRMGDDGRAMLRAVEATTRRPVELPERVRNQPGIGYLAGSPNYLVWSTDYQHAVAWRINSKKLTSYAIRDNRNRLQFLTLAGRFLMWFTGETYSVLDLHTGGAFDTTAPRSALINQVMGSETTIVRTDPLGTGKGAVGTVVSSLATPSAPSIPGCEA